jgi:hypothetical protein
MDSEGIQFWGEASKMPKIEATIKIKQRLGGQEVKN